MNKLEKIGYYNTDTGEIIDNGIEVIESIKKEEYKNMIQNIKIKFEKQPYSMTLEELQIYKKNIKRQKNDILKFKASKIDDNLAKDISLETLGVLFRVSSFMNKHGLLIYNNNKPVPSFEKLREKLNIGNTRWNKIKKEIDEFSLIVKIKNKNNEQVIIINPIYAKHSNFELTLEVLDLFYDDIICNLPYFTNNIYSLEVLEKVKSYLSDYDYTRLKFKLNPDEHYKVYNEAVKEEGIYLLYKDDSIIYIGKSSNIYNRIQQHRKDKQFNLVKSIVFKDNCNIDLYEPYLINKYKPVLNKDFIREDNGIELPEINLKE